MTAKTISPVTMARTHRRQQAPQQAVMMALPLDKALRPRKVPAPVRVARGEAPTVTTMTTAQA
ncbi:MAG TPA: hypothetical protein DCL54_14115, partial [Alphaproteobacteria bacterium]|nr:hypothetical protein [Alphaproteobacteria bacterium]